MQPNRRGFLSSLVAMPPALAIAAAAKPMPLVEPDPNIPGLPAPVATSVEPEWQPYFEGWKLAQIQREEAQQRLGVLTILAAAKVDAALAEAFDLPTDHPADVSIEFCEADDWIVFKDLDSRGQSPTEYGIKPWPETYVFACAAQMIPFSCTFAITPEQLESPETFVDRVHVEGLIAALRYRMPGAQKPLFVVSRGFKGFVPATAPITAITRTPLLIMRGVLSYDLERLTQVVSFEAMLGLALPKPERTASIHAVSSRHIESMQEQVAKAVADRLRGNHGYTFDFTP